MIFRQMCPIQARSRQIDDLEEVDTHLAYQVPLIASREQVCLILLNQNRITDCFFETFF